MLSGPMSGLVHWTSTPSEAARRAAAPMVAVIAALVMLMLTVSLVEAWVWSLAYLAVGTHVHAGVRLYRIRAEALRA